MIRYLIPNVYTVAVFFVEFILSYIFSTIVPCVDSSTMHHILHPLTFLHSYNIYQRILYRRSKNKHQNHESYFFTILHRNNFHQSISIYPSHVLILFNIHPRKLNHHSLIISNDYMFPFLYHAISPPTNSLYIELHYYVCTLHNR